MAWHLVYKTQLSPELNTRIYEFALLSHFVFPSINDSENLKVTPTRRSRLGSEVFKKSRTYSKFNCLWICAWSEPDAAHRNIIVTKTEKTTSTQSVRTFDPQVELNSVSSRPKALLVPRIFQTCSESVLASHSVRSSFHSPRRTSSDSRGTFGSESEGHVHPKTTETKRQQNVTTHNSFIHPRRKFWQLLQPDNCGSFCQHIHGCVALNYMNMK